jgi:tetratricopeptide (TPR) repeat protein
MRLFFLILLFISLSVYSQTSISVLKDIGVELSKLDKGLVKTLLEGKVKQSWDIKNEQERLKVLSGILEELKGLKLKAVATDLHKDVELCNYLIQQACILEALDGAGVKIIRDDLTGNLNDHAISVDGKRLLRRLVQLCEEAENSYKNVTYVEADGSDAKADLLTENIGTGVGVSLAMGDVTPLIAAAVKIGTGYSAINKSKSRQLELLIQAHHARIGNFLFNVNSYKNDLIAEENVARNKIITPECYREFLKALGEESVNQRLKKIEALVERFPHFNTVKLYLAKLYLKVGKVKESQEFVVEIINSKSRLLHKDGILGQAYFVLAKIYISLKNDDLALENLNLAIKTNPLNAFAWGLRSEVFRASDNIDKALEDSFRAHQLSPSNVDFMLSYFKDSVVVSKTAELDKLAQLFSLGFADLEKLDSWPVYKPYTEIWSVRSWLSPKIRLEYDPGIFKDDVVLTNVSAFAFVNLNCDLKIKFFKKGVWETVLVKVEIPRLEKGASFTFKGKFGMPKKSQASFQLAMTANQFKEKVSIDAYYNSFSNRETLIDWEYYREKAHEVYLSKVAKNMIINGLLDAEKAVALSYHTDSRSLSVLAHLHFKLGDAGKAIHFQKEALNSLLAEVGDADFAISSEPYKEALAKFKSQK